MKMINAGSADISNYAPYSKNCAPGVNVRRYLAPVPSISDVQLFVNFGTTRPTGLVWTIIDLCDPNNTGSIASDCYVIGWNGSYWYGVFKGFQTATPFDTFIIALTTGTRTFFSEQYQVQQSCETLNKISVVYPANYNAEDLNGIYIGPPDPDQAIDGNADIFYRHNFWTRQAEIFETANKINFTSNRFKNFATTLDKKFELRPELLPGWYKDYLLSVYFRGDIMINDVHAIVSDLNFEDVDVDYWKAYAVLGKEIIGGFGCTDYNLVDNDCACVGVSFEPPTFADAQATKPYIKTIAISGTGPFYLSAVTLPTWLTPDLSGNTLTLSGTPPAEAAAADIAFTITNSCGEQPFSGGTITVGPAPVGAHFGPTTFLDNGQPLVNEDEIANLVGTPGVTVTITLDTLTNTNGGMLEVNGLQAFQGYTWDLVLDVSGAGSLQVNIRGQAGNPNTSILGHFTITEVSSGTIGTPNTYQISKAF